MSHRVVDLTNRKISSQAGTKASNLQLLDKWGFRVPKTWCCLYDVYLHYKDDPEQAIAGLAEELETIVENGTTYAVRSAANIEDTLQQTFAGQFDSYLAVQGRDDILRAIQQVFDSIHTRRTESYFQASGIEISQAAMSVIIQEMIPPVLSGVAFSRHPMTGMDEVIIEATPGTSDAILQNGADPLRWVYKWGALKETPASGEWNETIVSVAQETRRIEERFGYPSDVEWVFDGERIYYIQARKIRIDDSQNFYSNRISREFLPGLIKPLVWSINIPLINGGWIHIIERLIGKTGLVPADLTKMFYHRAYFNMKKMGVVIQKLGMPSEALEIIMGREGGDEKPSMRPSIRAIRYLPRVLVFLISLLAVNKRAHRLLDRAKEEYDLIESTVGDIQTVDTALRLIDRLWKVNRKVVMWNILVPLLNSVQTMMLNRMAKKLGVEVDSLHVQSEAVSLYSPQPAMAAIQAQFAVLESDTRQRIKANHYAVPNGTENVAKFAESYDEFLTRFGHLSDSGNDFSAVPWREDPSGILQVIVEGLSDNPEREKTDRRIEIPRKLRGSARRAERYLVLKERTSFVYTRGYGLFRDLYFVLGSFLSDRGVISTKEDILYLTRDEVAELLMHPVAKSQKSVVEQRKRHMEQCAQSDLPEIIYGDEVPPPLPRNLNLHQLRGIGTSAGYYEGPVRIVRAVSDITNIEDGDIIIIPYSDISWTPAFTKAGAIISESGGMLSHSSIVAREFGIPCIVAVKGALSINDGERYSVDGHTGIVQKLGGAP